MCTHVNFTYILASNLFNQMHLFVLFFTTNSTHSSKNKVAFSQYYNFAFGCFLLFCYTGEFLQKNYKTSGENPEIIYLIADPNGNMLGVSRLGNIFGTY